MNEQEYMKENEKRLAEYQALPFGQQLRVNKTPKEQTEFALYKIADFTGNDRLRYTDYYPDLPAKFEDLPDDLQQTIAEKFIQEAVGVRALTKNASNAGRGVITLMDKVNLYYYALERIIGFNQEELNRPTTWADFKKIVAAEVAKGPLLRGGKE